ncbi:MAG: tRNA (cytidine(34)-2'-O)-methyltransferase [Alphaproteobacteria bacterium]
MRLALYQPDIPQNAGAVLRLGACLGVGVDIIGPCGFVLDDRRLRRAAMDYAAAGEVARHVSWDAFLSTLGAAGGRLVLLTAAPGATQHVAFPFRGDDILLLGRESVGIPESVHAQVESRVRVPMRPGLRSLNVVTAAAIVLGEALRQLSAFPGLDK